MLSLKENETRYYLVHDRFVAKRLIVDGHERAYRFMNGAWEEVALTYIVDKLVGFDPWEPEDSPFRFGGAGVFEIDEISEEEALRRIAEQTGA